MNLSAASSRFLASAWFKSEGHIDTSSFLDLAELIWGRVRTLFSNGYLNRVTHVTDIEPPTLTSVSWIESWFPARVFIANFTGPSLETNLKHFQTGVYEG